MCCNTVTAKGIVDCRYCDFTSCKSCAKKYLLESDQDPHCMGCRKTWNREHLMSQLSKTFVDKDLKTHREQVLFDRERAMMPATQHLVERELNVRAAQKQLRLLEEQKKHLMQQVRELSDTIAALNRNIHRMYTGQDPSSSEKKEFIRKCPADDCKGFLSTAWKCGICSSHVCKDCNEIYDSRNEHICDENAKKTMTLLNKDTKPCPSCGTLIHKLLGCDQMFCTNCKTAFSWKRGTVERGVIHNPHYYEMMRQNPGIAQRRNFGDFACGGLPGLYEARKFPSWCTESLRLLTHIERVEMPRFRTDNQQTNEHLRVLYMLNELSESAFKHEIQKREKARQKKQDIMDVLQMVHDTGADLLRGLFATNRPNDHRSISEVHCNLLKIQEYSHSALRIVSNRYSRCAVPVVHILPNEDNS